jgi:hypothetical protein
MPTPIDVDTDIQYLIIRNCISDNIIDAENLEEGSTKFLQHNWWGREVPDPTKIFGDIVYEPTMRRPCDDEAANPVVNQFPSSVRVGTMKNRRNILGGGYNSNF